jgi:hypothetical protein
MDDLIERADAACGFDKPGSLISLIDELSDRVKADAARIAELEAQIAEKERTYDDLYADALADAKSDAQDFDSDLWVEVRKYLTELHLDWRDYAEDGITADCAVQYIRDCMDGETARADRLSAMLKEAEEVGRKEAAYWRHISSPRYETAVKIADNIARLEAREEVSP